MHRFHAALATLLLVVTPSLAQDQHAAWRTATTTELQTALPARAPVEQERIETEMSSASGVTDGHGRIIAAVVLITAGYAAQGKYSHYLMAQAPLRLGESIRLKPGTYAIGWVHTADGLLVHVYDAQTGKEQGTALARIQNPPLKVAPVKLWPPSDRAILQIGRFALPYVPLD